VVLEMEVMEVMEVMEAEQQIDLVKVEAQHTVVEDGQVDKDIVPLYIYHY
jgi:hypothetical protein